MAKEKVLKCISKHNASHSSSLLSRKLEQKGVLSGNISDASTAANSPTPSCISAENRKSVRYAYEENAAIYLSIGGHWFTKNSALDPPAASLILFAGPVAHSDKVMFSYLAESLGMGFRCNEPAYVLALIYLEKVYKVLETKGLSPSFAIFPRLACTSLMVAVKFYDDVYYTNEYYSKILDLNLDVVNRLECQFLSLLAGELSVPPPQFHSMEQEFNEWRPRICAKARRPVLCGLATHAITVDPAILAYYNTIAQDSNVKSLGAVGAVLTNREAGQFRYQTEEEVLCGNAIMQRAKQIAKLQKQVIKDYRCRSTRS